MHNVTIFKMTTSAFYENVSHEILHDISSNDRAHKVLSTLWRLGFIVSSESYLHMFAKNEHPSLHPTESNHPLRDSNARNRFSFFNMTFTTKVPVLPTV